MIGYDDEKSLFYGMYIYFWHSHYFDTEQKLTQKLSSSKQQDSRATEVI